MKTLRTTAIAALLLAGAAGAASAQIAFTESNLDISDNGFKAAEGFFIPTVYLNVSHHGSMFVTSGSASAKAKYLVEGLENALVQELSRKIQVDLGTKLRAAGHKVMMYEDMKNDPEVMKRDRLELDKKLGIPTKDAAGAGGATYIIGTGTPEQAFKPAMQGISWAFRGVAKDHKLSVIIPEIWIETPQMSAEKTKGYKSSKASIDIDPGMMLRSFFVWTIGPKQAGGWVKLKYPWWDAAQNVGTVAKESEERMNLGLGMKRNKGDFTLTLNPEAFSEGVLRAGYAMNDAIVAAVQKTKK